MERYKDKLDVFVGVEYRLRKVKMEEQFYRAAKAGWRFAADAAKIAKGSTGIDDMKHTSRVVVIAVDNHLGAVLSQHKGAMESPKLG